jgi:nucleotide-binding universal stress UspA family protein
MTIQPMLLRLQSTFEAENLNTQMLLQPGLESFASTRRDRHAMNLVIGYNGSTRSQNALDFALWMAHQTRLATRKQVTVHGVYVLNQPTAQPTTAQPIVSHPSCTLPPDSQLPCGTTATLTRPSLSQSLLSYATEHTDPCTALEQADQILWQARCLADEWQSPLEAHLRFGQVPTELRRVVESQQADLLIVGCTSPKHLLVRQLTSKFPCPVLGIPLEL